MKTRASWLMVVAGAALSGCETIDDLYLFSQCQSAYPNDSVAQEICFQNLYHQKERSNCQSMLTSINNSLSRLQNEVLWLGTANYEIADRLEKGYGQTFADCLVTQSFDHCQRSITSPFFQQVDGLKSRSAAVNSQAWQLQTSVNDFYQRCSNYFNDLHAEVTRVYGLCDEASQLAQSSMRNADQIRRRLTDEHAWWQQRYGQ